MSQEPTAADPSVQHVACPNCQVLVPYASFCSNCGANLPPIYAPVAESRPPSRRRSRAFLLGIILVVVIAASVASVAGYMYYQNGQQAILKTAENSELIAANQAVNNWGFVCFSSHNDTSNFVRGNPPSGYIVFYEKFGIYNPSRFSIDATWTFQFSYPAISTTIVATQSFTLPAKSTSYADFPFIISAQDAQAFASVPAGTIPQYTVILDGTYTVHGIYSTYNISQHQSYDSSTNTGTGQIGSGSTTGSTSGTLPACP